MVTDAAPGSHLHVAQDTNAICSIMAAQETDAPEIARLSLALGYQITAEETRNALKHMLACTNYFAVVASAGTGPLLGWLTAERRRSLESGESVELTGLVVSAAARRLGVGRALVAAAERWTQDHGFYDLRVRSNVVRAESHSFYEGMGFERTKTQHVYKKALIRAA